MTNYLPPINTNDDEHALEMLFADLFKRHEQRLYALALGLTKSEEYAKDIIQEVFLKLWEQRQHLNEIHNMEAWLYRVMENKVIDFLRKTAADSRLIDNIWNNASRARNDTDEMAGSERIQPDRSKMRSTSCLPSANVFTASIKKKGLTTPR